MADFICMPSVALEPKVIFASGPDEGAAIYITYTCRHCGGTLAWWRRAPVFLGADHSFWHRAGEGLAHVAEGDEVGFLRTSSSDQRGMGGWDDRDDGAAPVVLASATAL